MSTISAKTLPKIAMVILSLLLVIIASVNAPLLAANENETTDRRIITTGYAELAAIPDVATITIGAQYTDPIATVAQAEVAKRIEAVLTALHKAGIPDEAIHTSSYRVNPQYVYKDGENILRGHTVSHQLIITLNDLSMLGKLFDTVVSVGATNIDNVQFNTSKAVELQRQALQTAIADARQKAEALAAGAGLGNIRIIRIQDESPKVKLSRYDLGNESVAKSWFAADTEIIPGEVTISASVTVEYAF